MRGSRSRARRRPARRDHPGRTRQPVLRVPRADRVPRAVNGAVNEFVRRDLRAAAIPWLVSRVLVGGALAIARYGFGELKGVERPVQLDQGLFAWDAAHYRAIAEHGYGAAEAGLRFFPL